MKPQITLRNLHTLCKGMMDWEREVVEERFQGTRKELVDALNKCTELEVELFFSGFFCDNPVVAWATDGQVELKKLSAEEKVQIFIRRGNVLCYLTNHEPGFVVKPYWSRHNTNLNEERKEDNGMD